MASQTDWPPSLKEFANQAFAACTDANRSAVSEELRSLIFSSFQQGTIQTTDWSRIQLASLSATKPKLSKVGKKGTKREITQGSASPPAHESWDERQRKEKRAKRFEREQQDFQRREDETLPVTASLASRFGGSSSTLVSRPVSALVDAEVADPNVIDWDKHTVVGTSAKLEKPYLRLTSAPDPKTVRPLVTLTQTLELLKKKWRTENNYSYICDQFKSMRQDLTVQRIKNEFTVKVYEIHARIALEMADLGEYNQCQSQLRGLYTHGIRGNQMEFLAYRILYLLHTRNRRDVNAIMAELTREAKDETAVAHALQVRSALVTGNYHQFFALYTDAPNMNSYIMDHFVERERINALLVMSKCYRPSLSLTFLTEELAFQDVQEADAFLQSNQAAHYLDVASTLPVPSVGKKKAKKVEPPPPPPLETRQWDAKAAMEPLTLAMVKYRKIDIKGQI